MTLPQNRYEIIQTLGTGATSRVDKARDTVIGRTVAVKTFLRGFNSGDVQKQFLREAQIFGRLSHPYIVGLYDVGVTAEGVPYLVMEYVEGKTLEAALGNGRLPLERAAIWAADLASALALAHHAQVIHGDVKPANILITKDGQVKLGDFGIARFATQVSGSGTILGTPAYLSPEQILGHKQDSRSDLFSLGIILYQMSTGVRPFDGTSIGAVCAQIVAADPLPPSHHNPELPPAFDHIVMRCLAKNPADRYATAESLGASLYPFARSKPVDLRPASPPWWRHPMQTGDLRLAASVAAALILFGAGAHAVRQHYSSQPARDSSVRHLAPAPSSGSPVGAGGGSNANSGVSTTGSLINISSSDLNPLDGRSQALKQENTTDAPTNSADGEVFSNFFSSPVDHRPASTQVAPAFEQRPGTTAKSKRLRSAGSKTALLPSSATPPAAEGGSGAPTATPTTSAAASATIASLHVDVVATISDEILSVYAGDQLLLTTPLQAAHLGDTLRFDCPITPGEHSFRVVLTRPDESLLLEKRNTTQIRPDASNFLGVHVIRRAKLLLKHETSLEVVWPSTAAPVATVATTNAAYPVGASAVQ